MTSPHLLAASKSTRTESELRTRHPGAYNIDGALFFRLLDGSLARCHCIAGPYAEAVARACDSQDRRTKGESPPPVRPVQKIGQPLQPGQRYPLPHLVAAYWSHSKTRLPVHIVRSGPQGRQPLGYPLFWSISLKNAEAFAAKRGDGPHNIETVFPE